ncbi:MAG: NADH-quinone oxidoreductase subunit D [Chloroflexi bacterium]|nr:NADH-quinone oxidoreductase subunit D [Chloroflexota bacterium]
MTELTASPQGAATTAPDLTLDAHFPDAVQKDTRPGYSGYLVNADKLVEVVSVYPGADFQEREAWDLLGIRFAGHPYLKRILMWEGFAGHPLRKDWREPYYEEDHKPFDTRWPGGDFHRSEENNPFGTNVQYPPDFSVDGWVPEAEDAIYAGAGALKESGNGHELKTDKLVVNLGPQHPSTHGVFRMVVSLNGETIDHLEPVMGYLHRNHEKIGERNTYLQNMPYTDRLDYICSMSNNHGYALAVEQLQKAKVPERAEYIRVLMVELTRICNHMWAIGFLLNDLGAFFTPALYAIKERELILDLFEATAGSRMMCNYMRFGGVYRDLPEKFKDGDTIDFLRELVNERLPRAIDDLDTYLTNNEIIRSRCIGMGVLPPDKAIAYSTAGPVLRASGVPYDVRRADPYSIYDRFDFDVAVRYNGDVYDRYLIRLDEMRQSVRICQQVVRDLPNIGGDIMSGKLQYQVRVPAGEAYGRVENPKGELGYYVVSNGKANPWRYHIRAPSFINLTVLGELCKGHKVADVVGILGSIDIVLGETDR